MKHSGVAEATGGLYYDSRLCRLGRDEKHRGDDHV